MTIYKCLNCLKAFASERGLSSHFHHKQVCKSIHYGIPNDDFDKYNLTLKNTNINKKNKHDSYIHKTAPTMNNNIIQTDQVCVDQLDQRIQQCISEKMDLSNNCYTNSDSLFGDEDNSVVMATPDKSIFQNMSKQIQILPTHFIMMSKLKAIS